MNGNLKNEIIQLILSSIKTLTERYGVKINFSDVFGAFMENPEFNTLLSPFDFHDNEFCNLIKKDKQYFKGCLECKRKIERKCNDTRTCFSGYCHMGLYEFIFPIFHRDILLAFLCIGEFSKNPNFQKIAAFEQKNKLEKESLSKIFRSVTHELPENTIDLIYDFKMLTFLFSYLYANYSQSGKEQLYDNPIVNKTIFYVLSHYSESISLESIAAHCYCNKNYLSELFYQTTKKHLFDYINEIRIHNAIQWMRIKNSPISDIATSCGFNNISYFSTVFKKFTGCSPTEYKLNILKGSS